MVYDCFSFFNELDLLEIRLNILNDVVDKFVLVEATKTHTGKPKPLYFQDNKNRFSAFSSKIIHIIVDDFPDPHPEYDKKQASWMRENIQRNAIMRGLDGARDDDFIIISDLDEIPRPESIALAMQRQGISLCLQMFMNFFVNYRDHVRPWWRGSRMLKYNVLNDSQRIVAPHYAFIEDFNRGMTPTRVRFVWPDHVLKNAGWHFSYLGGTELALKKICAVGLEHDERYSLNKEQLMNLIERGGDVTGSGGHFFAIPLDSHLPSYILANVDRYEHLIYRPSGNYFTRTRLNRFCCALRGDFHRAIARMLPSCVKPFLFTIYSKLVTNPINQ